MTRIVISFQVATSLLSSNIERWTATSAMSMLYTTIGIIGISSLPIRFELNQDWIVTSCLDSFDMENWCKICQSLFPLHVCLWSPNFPCWHFLQPMIPCHIIWILKKQKYILATQLGFQCMQLVIKNNKTKTLAPIYNHIGQTLDTITTLGFLFPSPSHLGQPLLFLFPIDFP